MTKREVVSIAVFIVLAGGLLVSDPAGRATLGAPVSIGVTLPRWVVWSATLLAFGMSFLVPRRPLRVTIGLLLMHAFIPVQPLNPLFWIAFQEACLLAFVLLLDLSMVAPSPSPPDGPRRGPAVAFRQAIFGPVSAIYERRRREG